MEEALRNKGWQFMQDDHLGYIVSCPSNLGTGLRASVHIKIPLLSKVSKFFCYCFYYLGGKALLS